MKFLSLLEIELTFARKFTAKNFKRVGGGRGSSLPSLVPRLSWFATFENKILNVKFQNLCVFYEFVD
jgi:hypothetical protein